MSNDNESKISRRGFIALGSAGVAAAVAMPGSLFAAQPAASGLVLSVGYWSGSSVLDKLSDWRKPAGGQFDVVDAASYEQGDFGFLQGRALVNVAGLGAPSKTLRSLQLRALFNSNLNGGTDMVPFDAWSYRNDGSSVMSSPGIRFRMPVLPETGLRFSVEAELVESRARAIRTGSASAGVRQAETTIALSGSGPKLMRGVYFLAVTDSPVAWNDYEFSLKGESQGPRRLVRADWTGSSLAPFPYLVMTVDLEVAE